jgi:hypothetical protein
MSKFTNDSATLTPISARGSSGPGYLAHALLQLQLPKRVVAIMKSAWASIAQRVMPRSTATAMAMPVTEATAAYVRIGVPINRERLAPVVAEVQRRYRKHSFATTPEAVMDALEGVVTVTSSQFVEGQITFTSAEVAGVLKVGINHATGRLHWIRPGATPGTWTFDFTAADRDLVPALDKATTTALTAATKANEPGGSGKIVALPEEVVCALGRAFAPLVAAALFEAADAPLAEEVRRLTGVNPGLFAWAKAGGDPVRQALRRAAIRRFPLLPAVVATLEPERLMAVEQAIDLEQPLLPALASVLETTESVLGAAHNIYPKMLGQRRWERLVRSDFKTAAAVPITQLPGCGGVRIDVAWRNFIDACRMKESDPEGPIEAKNLTAASSQRTAAIKSRASSSAS